MSVSRLSEQEWILQYAFCLEVAEHFSLNSVLNVKLALERKIFQLGRASHKPNSSWLRLQFSCP